MTPSPQERDELLGCFAKALFKRDLNALYTVVTEDFVWKFHDGLTVATSLSGRDAIGRHIASQRETFASQRFEDVTYVHTPEVTFMTCRVEEIERTTGKSRTQHGVELYTFKDRKIAMKDVYRKPAPTFRDHALRNTMS
jgi:ketosteroid isomerase-like protein